MSVAVSWLSVFPESAAPANDALAFRHLAGVYLADKLGDELLDRVHEVLANSTREGLDVLEELAVAFPQSPQLLSGLAGICEDKGWHDAAAWYLRQAIELRPERTSFRHRMGRVLYTLGQPEAALAELRYAVSVSARPGRDLLVELATLELDTGDRWGARITAQLHQLYDPEEPFAAAVLAVCAAGDGDRAAADRHADRARLLLYHATALDDADAERVEALLEWADGRFATASLDWVG